MSLRTMVFESIAFSRFATAAHLDYNGCARPLNYRTMCYVQIVPIRTYRICFSDRLFKAMRLTSLLWAIVVLLVVLWLIGLVANIAGFAVHLLLVIAVVVVGYNLLVRPAPGLPRRRRSPVSGQVRLAARRGPRAPPSVGGKRVRVRSLELAISSMTGKAASGTTWRTVRPTLPRIPSAVGFADASSAARRARTRFRVDPEAAPVDRYRTCS